MKITIVQGAFLPVPPLLGGAVEKIWHALSAEFSRHGHQVTHVSRAYGELPPRETNAAGVQHRRVRGFNTPRSLAWLKLLDLVYSWRVRRALPAADILVTNTFWLPVLCRAASRGRIYVHVARYPRWQMRWYTRAARLQTLTPALGRAIRAQAPALADRVSVIANPRLADLTVDAEALDALRGSREPVFLYVGRVHPEKGLELLLEAFRRFCAETGGWRLRIVGPWETALGGGGEEFRRRLDEIAGPAATRLEWAGFIADPAALREHFTRASLFIYPSLAEEGEASPMAPLEAMSCGCPALVSSMDCFSGYLTANATGFTFDHRAPDPAGALSRRLSELSANPAELERVGRAGWEKTAEFSLDRIAAAYLADFEKILASK